MTDSRDFGEFGSIDALFGHPYRWAAYKLLTEHTTMALADLADEIAVWEEDSSIGEIAAEDVLVIYTALYETHVPTLERSGIVQYDQDRDLVSLTGYGASASVDVSTFAEGATDSSTEGPPFAEESLDENTVTVELSVETINVIHKVLTTDERFEAEMAYDDVIRAVLTETYA